jgi:hypothetical protein
MHCPLKKVNAKHQQERRNSILIIGPWPFSGMSHDGTWTTGVAWTDDDSPSDDAS